MASSSEVDSKKACKELIEELNLMGAALRRNNFKAARHHQFIATVMLNELNRKCGLNEPVASNNDKIMLSSQARVVQA